MMSWTELKDLWAGETCIVIGNGPSLKDVANDDLECYPSFGTNKIYLKDGFEPTYYACINPYVCEQVMDSVKDMNCLKFSRDGLIPGSLPLHPEGTPEPAFSFRPDKFIYEGFTVTYVCLQIAFYMGFDTVLLYGIDHRFDVDGKPNELVTGVKDNNHFHPLYFKESDQWQLPDLVMSERYYRLADTVYKNHGRRILNLTKGTALTTFQRIDEYA